MRKWIACLLLAVFLPASAMAQACAGKCAYASQAMSAEHKTLASAQPDASMAGEHCAKKNAQSCLFASVCDFANLCVLTTEPIKLAPVPLPAGADFFRADFTSVIHPPALRPPAA